MITIGKVKNDTAAKFVRYYFAQKFVVAAQDDGGVLLLDYGSYLVVSDVLYRHSFSGEAMADIRQGHQVEAICCLNDDFIASCATDGSVIVYSLGRQSKVLEHNHGTALVSVQFYNQSVITAGIDGVVLQIPVQSKHFWSSLGVKVLCKLEEPVIAVRVVGDCLVMVTQSFLTQYAFDQKSVVFKRTFAKLLKDVGVSQPRISVYGQYMALGLSGNFVVFQVLIRQLKLMFAAAIEGNVMNLVIFDRFVYIVTNDKFQVRSAINGKLIVQLEYKCVGDLHFDAARTCYMTESSLMTMLTTKTLAEIYEEHKQTRNFGSVLDILQNKLQLSYFNKDKQFNLSVNDVAREFAITLTQLDQAKDAVNVLSQYHVVIDQPIVDLFINYEKLEIILPLMLDLRQQFSADLVMKVIVYCIRLKLTSWLRLCVQMWIPYLSEQQNLEILSQIKVVDEESAITMFVLFDSVQNQRFALKALIQTSDIQKAQEYYELSKLSQSEVLGIIVELAGEGRGMEETIDVMLDELSKEALPKFDNTVVQRLKKYKRYLHVYLHAAHGKDQRRTEPYRDLQVQLYSEFGREGQLLHFLERTSNYDLRKALDVCEGKTAETVVIYRKIGDFRKALETLTSSGNEQSIFDFCKQINDPYIWMEVQQLAIDNNALMRLLLLFAHEHIDLSRLVRMIPDNTPIQSDINQAMCGALKEQIIYKNLVAGCNDIFAEDKRLLLMEFLKFRRRGQRQICEIQKL